MDINRYDLYGVTLETAFGFATPGPVGDGVVDVRFDCREADPLDLDSSDLVDGQGRWDDGQPHFAFYDRDDHAVVRISGATDFVVGDERIRCHLIEPRHAYLVEIALLGMVFALWLERRGTPTLHASSVAIDGEAVAFLGNKGGGKTTLATACVAAGHALLVDDLLAIKEAGTQAHVQRGWPALRLWPDQLRHFAGAPRGLPLVHPDYDKRRVVVGDGFGRFADGPGELKRIYLPQRDPAAADVEVSTLPSHAATMALVRHSFLPREVQRFGLQPHRLRLFAKLISQLPVAILRYPTGFERLPQVVCAIEDDLRSG